jgi:thymidine kinase
MTAHNYKERQQNVILYKPIIDNREGIGSVLKSRCGISSDEVHMFDDETNLYFDFIGKDNNKKADCVIVDEAQFLTKEQVKQLTDIVDKYNIPVICYGLRTNFKGELFEGSKTLLSLADSIEEIKTICWCGKKAIMNARLKDGKIVKSGDEIQIGGNESYISLCRKHWKDGATHY